LLFVAGGAAHSLPAITFAAGSHPVVAVARSADGSTTAVVVRTATGMRLLTAQGQAPLRRRLSATTITTPTFDVDGEPVCVTTDRTGRHVVVVEPSGRLRRIGADASLVHAPVLALRISPDGARVAAVVGDGRLLIGRVAGRGTTEALGGFHAVLPAASGLTGLGWVDADSVAVTAPAGAGRQVLVVDADGYASHAVSTRGIDGVPVDLAVAPDQPLVVSTGTRLWRQATGGWAVIRRGSAPVYGG
jgi:hypothetical protein